MHALLSAALSTCFACTPAVHAADDLMAVARAALANDAQYQSARAQSLATSEKLPQARAGLLPSLTVSGTTQWNDVTVKQPVNAASQHNSHNFNFQLTQPLFRWANWVQFEQGKLQVAAAEAQLAQARQDVLLRAAQAYFDLLYAHDVLRRSRPRRTPRRSSSRWRARASKWARSPSPMCMKRSRASIWRTPRASRRRATSR